MANNHCSVGRICALFFVLFFRGLFCFFFCFLQNDASALFRIIKGDEQSRLVGKSRVLSSD